MLTTMARVVALTASVGAVVMAQQQAPPPLVTAQEILDGLKDDGSRWLTFGGNYSNHRHSPLTQITPQNVSRLTAQWTFQTGTLGNFQATSLLRDNVLYVTGPQNVAWAIDARTGRQIWRYRRELPDGLRSEEHTSELQSLAYLVCSLLLEKKKKKSKATTDSLQD